MKEFNPIYRVAILGASGMIGHKLAITLNVPEISLKCWVRSEFKVEKLSTFISPDKISVINLTPENFNKFSEELNEFNPDYIINCIGVTIRKEKENSMSNLIFANSLLPHLLNKWINSRDKKLIHFSTDCVFNGADEVYYDQSQPNELSLYGKSKGLGEIAYSENSLTLRGSMIGRELFDNTELLEWFLKQEDRIVGYGETYYSGITVARMSSYIKKIIIKKIKINGLYNVSSLPISKYRLLNIFNTVYNKKLTITNDRSKISKKILNSEKFHFLIGEKIPDWEKDLIKDLEQEKLYYE